MYELAQKEGYSKSYDDFITLLNTNEEAFNTMYGLAQKEGYPKPIDDFYTLMGVKKKDAASQQDSVLGMDSTVPTSGTVPQAQPQSGDAVLDPCLKAVKERNLLRRLTISLQRMGTSIWMILHPTLRLFKSIRVKLSRWARARRCLTLKPSMLRTPMRGGS